MGTFSHLGCPLVKKCELSKQWRDYWCRVGVSGTEEAWEEPPHLSAAMQSWKDNLVCTLGGFGGWRRRQRVRREEVA